MKKLLTGLILVVATASVFARDCDSRNLNKEFDRLNAIAGISFEEKNILFEMTKGVKLTEILTCSGLKRVYLSTEEAEFAEYELNKDRIADIEEIKSDERRLKSLLQDTNLDEHDRGIYSRSLRISLCSKRQRLKIEK